MRARLAQLRAADAALSRVPVSEPSAALFSQIGARIAAAESPKGKRSAAQPKRLRRPSFGTTAAFAAAAAVAALLLWPNPPEESPRDIARLEPLAPASPRIEQIEEEFGGLLEPEAPADSLARAEPGEDPLAGNGDLAVIEVLEFLEDLGDLGEAGRG